MHQVRLVVLLEGVEHDLGERLVKEAAQVSQEVLRDLADLGLELDALPLATPPVQVVVVPADLLLLIYLADFKVFI